jgi:hypothetical protein
MEKRGYFRLKEDLSIEFREIDQSDFDNVKERMAFESGKLLLEEKLWKSEGRESSQKEREYGLLISYIQIIEKKLDKILERMEEKNGGPSFSKSLRTIDISGSGVRFLSQKRPGRPYLELVISIPRIHPRKIRTIAEIVRVGEKKTGEHTSWEIAAKYLEIAEEDRDVLISYIIDREREAIKKSKADE